MTHSFKNTTAFKWFNTASHHWAQTSYYRNSSTDVYRNSVTDFWRQEMEVALTAESGSYLITGQDVTLPDISITCDSGSYTIFGYTISGQPIYPKVYGDWKDFQDLGAWTFTEQPDKWGYLNNPRWVPNGSATVKHLPCGHWHKRAKPAGVRQETTYTEFSSGRWVAAMPETTRPYFYVYDIDYYRIVKIDISGMIPKVYDILTINDSDFELDRNAGYGNPGAQRGAYRMDTDETTIWYLFTGVGGEAGNHRLVSVDISGDVMSIRNTTEFSSLLTGSDAITDAAADGTYVYFSTTHDSGQIIQFDYNHNLILNKDFGFTVTPAREDEPIASIDIDENYLYGVYVRSKDGTNGERHIFSCYKDLIINLDYASSGSGFSAPRLQNFIRLYGGFIWKHRAYWPPQGPLFKYGTDLLYKSAFDNLSYCQNILGIYNNYLYTLRHDNSADFSAYLHKADVATLTDTTETDVSYYYGASWPDGEAWEWTSVSCLVPSVGRIAMIRWPRDTTDNIVAVFDADFTLLSDTEMKDYLKITETTVKPFEEQDTTEEPMIWALPGSYYNKQNNQD